MSFRMYQYQELKQRIMDAIHSYALKKKTSESLATSLNNAYTKNTQDPIFLAKQYSNIEAQRRTEIGILLTTISCLDASSFDDEKKQKILFAMTYFVREGIDLSYSQKSLINLVSFLVTSSKNSKLFGYLGLALDINISIAKGPSIYDLHQMYSELKLFLFQHIYKAPQNDLEQEYFSSRKIENFNPHQLFDHLIKRIASLERSSINRVGMMKEGFFSAKSTAQLDKGEAKIVSHSPEAVRSGVWVV